MASIRLSVFNDSTFNLQNAISDAREVGSSSRSLLERCLQFKRAEELFPDFQSHLFTNISPDAIQPNPDIREYNFWRILKHLATAPELVRSLFVKLDDNRRGQFSVYVTKEDRDTLKAEDKKTEIEIDTMIPVIKIGENQYKPAFCQIVGKDIWPLLFEKAVMKAFRSLSLMMCRLLLDSATDYMTQYTTIGLHSFRRLEASADAAFDRNDIFDFNYVGACNRQRRKLIFGLVTLQPVDSDEPIQEEFYPVIKRRPVSGGRYLLKLMNYNTNKTPISDKFHPRNLNISEIETRDIDLQPREKLADVPEYIYAFNTEVTSTVKTLCAFEYTTIPPKISRSYSVSSDSIYLGIFNQNPSQEIVINLVQDPTKAPTIVRILLARVDTAQKKVRLVKLYCSDLAKNSLVFTGGDHLLIIDSEMPQTLNLSRRKLIRRVP